MIDFLKKKGVKDTLIYTLTDGISKALSFLLLPLISFYLIPEQLGIAANFDVLQQILSLCAGQAIVNGLPYFYYEKSKKEVARFVGNLFIIIVVLNLFFSILIFFTCGFIEKLLHISLSLQLLTVVAVISQLTINIDMVLLRLEERPTLFAKFQIFQTVLNLSLLILFVVVWKMEALGKIYCAVFSLFIMAAIHLAFLLHRHYISFQIDKTYIKDLLHFGIPLLPHSLSFWIKGSTDKILLTAFCGLTSNGLYSMAMSFGAVFNIFITAFNNAFVPYLQKRLNLITPETELIEKKRIVNLSYKIGGCFTILSILSLIICYIAIQFVLDAKYKDSFQIIPYILLSLLFNAFYSLVIQYPYTVKKTLGLGIITFCGSLMQLLLSYIFIYRWGSDGIKASLVIGSFIIMLGVWWYSNKVYPMPWFSVKGEKINSFIKK